MSQRVARNALLLLASLACVLGAMGFARQGGQYPRWDTFDGTMVNCRLWDGSEIQRCGRGALLDREPRPIMITDQTRLSPPGDCGGLASDSR